MKLKISYIPTKCIAVNVPHYDIHTDEKKPSNVACVATSETKIIKKMVKLFNEQSKTTLEGR